MDYSIEAPVKDPNAVLDYEVSWANWLLTGETIDNATVIVANGHVTVSSVTVVGAEVRFRMTGGVAGQDCFVIVRVLTSSGQQDERTVRIPVRQR